MLAYPLISHLSGAEPHGLIVASMDAVSSLDGQPTAFCLMIDR
jgi:hypothetical protein